MIRALGLLAVLTGQLSVAATHRVAITIGANEGHGGETRLAWAELDAKRTAEALRELGDFESIEVLLSPEASAVEAALARARSRIEGWRSDGSSTLAILYYSGHAGPDGLHLGNGTFTQEALEAALSSLGADVRIAVVDACASGSLIRTKGVVAQPLGHVELRDELDVRGQALLASTGRDESAQESDALQGSFFTSALLAGLRGAADANDDGEVGLREAYAYAYERTVRSTVTSSAGTQHPMYAVRLSGTHDVPLTWVTRSRAKLSFRSRSDGPFLILREPEETVVAELSSAPGLTRRLGLREGAYVVKKRSSSGLLVGRVRLEPGVDAVLDEAEMQRLPYVALVRKGAGPPPSLTVTAGLARGLAAVPVVGGLEVGTLIDLDWLTLWPALGGFVGREVFADVASIAVLSVKPSLRAGHLFRGGGVELFAGLSAGVPITFQWVQVDPTRVSVGVDVTAVGAGSVRLSEGLAILLQLDAGARWARFESGDGWRFLVGGQVGLRVRFDR